MSATGQLDDPRARTVAYEELLDRRNRCAFALAEAELELAAFHAAQEYLRAHASEGLVIGRRITPRNELPARVRAYLPEGRP